MAFGDIESVTISCLSELSNEQIAQVGLSLRFSKRVDLVVATINSRNLGNAGVRLTQLLSEAKSEATTRNLIVHNPLALEISEKNLKAKYRHVITSYNERKIIGFDELERFAKRVEKLADGILNAWAEVIRLVPHKPP